MKNENKIGTERNIVRPLNPNGYDVTLNVKDGSPFSLLPSPLIKREVLQKIFKSISSNSLSYELTCQILSLAQDKSLKGKKEKKKHLDRNSVCIKIGDYLIFKKTKKFEKNSDSNDNQDNSDISSTIDKNRAGVSLDSMIEKEVENAEAEGVTRSNECNTLSEKESKSEDDKGAHRRIMSNNVEIVFQKVRNSSSCCICYFSSILSFLIDSCQILFFFSIGTRHHSHRDS